MFEVWKKNGDEEATRNTSLQQFHHGIGFLLLMIIMGRVTAKLFVPLFFSPAPII